MASTISTPGFTNDLGEIGRRGWANYINGILAGSSSKPGVLASATEDNNGVAPSVLLDGDPDLQPGLLPIDWKGYPVRIKQAINKPDKDLDPFIDWSVGGETISRGTCQEEYLEWRTVRRSDGKITRIEFTTETPDYWSTLARYEPKKLVELAARFAGELPNAVDIPELFGTTVNPFSIDPFSPEGQQVEQAYRRQNWSDQGRIKGAYNNGVKSILHMAVSANSTNAAVALAVYAAYAHGKRVGVKSVALSGPEAIEATRQAAVNCRNSDPTIVGVAIEKVFAGARIALMEAIGLYILTPSESIGLTFRNGVPVPSTWFSRQRGSDSFSNPVKVDLFQRLVIEAPPGSVETISDIFDADGNQVTSGTSIARHINVALYVRKTADAPDPNPLIVQAPRVPPCDGSTEDSADFKDLWKRYLSVANDTPRFAMQRGAKKNG